MIEKGFSGFGKTAPTLFYSKPRDAPPPLVFIPRTPQVGLAPLYLHGRSPGGPFRGAGVPGTNCPVYHIFEVIAGMLPCEPTHRALTKSSVPSLEVSRTRSFPPLLASHTFLNIEP